MQLSVCFVFLACTVDNCMKCATDKDKCTGCKEGFALNGDTSCEGNNIQ